MKFDNLKSTIKQEPSQISKLYTNKLTVGKTYTGTLKGNLKVTYTDNTGKIIATETTDKSGNKTIEIPSNVDPISLSRSIVFNKLNDTQKKQILDNIIERNKTVIPEYKKNLASVLLQKGFGTKLEPFKETTEPAKLSQWFL